MSNIWKFDSNNFTILGKKEMTTSARIDFNRLLEQIDQCLDFRDWNPSTEQNVEWNHTFAILQSERKVEKWKGKS